jgi:hypothetical protein
MNDGDLTGFHCCGTAMRPCRGCGEARCLRCDPYRPERECGSGPLLLEVPA